MSADALRRTVRHPLTDEMLRPLPPETIVVQVEGTLTGPEFARLNELLSGSPTVALRVFVYSGERSPAADLDFLQHLPGLRGLHVDWPDVRDLHGLAAVADSLLELSLHTARRKTSLAPLRQLTAVEDLGWGGSYVDLDAVADLPSLRELGLVRVPLAELFSKPFRGSIERLSLFGPFGQKRLDLAPDLRGLRFLELQRNTALADADAVRDLPLLEGLTLDTLSALTRLPDLAGLSRLERLELHGLRRLTDLGPVRSAPALRELVLSGVPVTAPDVVAALAGLPLRAATIGLSSRTQEEAAREQLALPQASSAVPWQIPRLRRPVVTPRGAAPE
ncbi:hypothetical protein [Symbioplanes lichenis]|uniref:hypothetical protein n=1 Tax=Symbioplanes lichenis TaxID=1629072 RepID=UPI0027387F48|nr:hypothetical protein [Actinoplanes lichenis]